MTEYLGQGMQACQEKLKGRTCNLPMMLGLGLQVTWKGFRLLPIIYGLRTVQHKPSKSGHGTTISAVFGYVYTRIGDIACLKILWQTLASHGLVNMQYCKSSPESGFTVRFTAEFGCICVKYQISHTIPAMFSLFYCRT
jgi:hypothetical protein